MKPYLMVDFGSTFTKLTAIDLEKCEILGVSKSHTTVKTNVLDGFSNALDELYKIIGKTDFECKLASSSAYGGLKMISVGLVKDLTTKAAQLAATSAGAKVLKTFSYSISESEKNEIYEINPDILLLTGGIDGGNKEVILHNAKMISQIDRNFAIIVSGNKSAQDEIKSIFKNSRNVVFCENVMPEFNKLNIMPTKIAIQKIFIENIIKAKGLDKAQLIMNENIVPTPLAVYNAAELLATGCDDEDGIGELMLYDVGGATTDVYSMSKGFASQQNVFLQGITEPFAKRTVEGDIGMRYSLSSLIDLVGIKKIAHTSDVTESEILDFKNNCEKNPDFVAKNNTKEKRIDEEIAKYAVELSSLRHCGFTEDSYTPLGLVKIQTGKDLTKVKFLIGTGGAIINSQNPMDILKKSTYSLENLNILKPINPTFMIDKNNIFAAMGLLSKVDKESALKIMKKEILKID